MCSITGNKHDNGVKASYAQSVVSQGHNGIIGTVIATMQNEGGHTGCHRLLVSVCTPRIHKANKAYMSLNITAYENTQ